MKLLLDENISHRLAPLLQSNFPDSAHVTSVGLAGATDRSIFNYAIENGFTLVTKDDDFVALVAATNFAHSIILIRLGNVSSQQIEQALNGSAERIETLIAAGTRVVEIN
jgi:predicted nuclease of predicted toxin-antitoxin system